MKKIASILLVIAMVFTVAACSGNDSGDTDTAAQSADTTTENDAAASESSVAETEMETSPEESTDAFVDPSVNADEIGFFYSGVDPQSRDTYEIVFSYTQTLLLYEMMTQSYNGFADKLNVTITPTTAEGDLDLLVTNLEVYAAQGADGFIVSVDPSINDRLIEILDETGIPYLSLFNSMRDDDGNSLVPTVGLDQYAAGEITLQWLYDNYSTYWGDIDTSNLGLISLTYSTSVDLKDRGDGAEELFAELFPDNTDLIFVSDCASSSELTADTGYNMVAAIIAAHPEVEYWFITSCLEMYSQGAARAAEQLNVDDSTLIVDVGSDILCSEWDNGYDGSWAACLAISNYLYAAPSICGLVSLIDGVSTPGSLWPDMKQDGDTGAFYGTPCQMVTSDTYKDYFNGIAEIAGMDMPYSD